MLEEDEANNTYLKKEERKALANLKKDKDVLIMKADKGNATVLMNKVDYERKMTDLLQSNNYIKIRKDPMTIIEKRVKEHLTGLGKNDHFPLPF